MKKRFYTSLKLFAAAGSLLLLLTLSFGFSSGHASAASGVRLATAGSAAGSQAGSSAAGGIGKGKGCTGSGCGQQCGAPDQNPYTPAIDIGCRGKGNPIMDALFGIVRFLSDGVGLVVVGSIIVGGIQYSGSRGDPQSTAMAINRIRSSLYALLIYIFAYAILNYLIPGAVLQ
jgi:hypothetical protein